MTDYTVAGFDRPQALYEFASTKGVHAGSMQKLMEFAIELQQRALANATTKEEKEKTE
ncbi:MAG TPA: hypothetical protein VF534_27180 [Paraburkholderia sp.]